MRKGMGLLHIVAAYRHCACRSGESPSLCLVEEPDCGDTLLLLTILDRISLDS
jgi:hypothetical protein